MLKRSRYYDPEADKEAKIDELRVLYESSLIAKEDVTGDSHDEDHAFISNDVARFFETEEPRESRVRVQTKKERELAKMVPEVCFPSPSLTSL